MKVLLFLIAGFLVFFVVVSKKYDNPYKLFLSLEKKVLVSLFIWLNLCSVTLKRDGLFTLIFPMLKFPVYVL